MTYTAWSVVYGEQPSASKWNQLGTNDAHFYSFLGDNLAWQTWSPTLTNLSGGTTDYAKYTKAGKTVHVAFSYTLAGAGISGNPRVSVPVAAATYQYPASGYNRVGLVAILDLGINNYFGSVCFDSTTGSFSILVDGVGGTYATPGGITSTTPFTWGANDKFNFTAIYEAA